MKILLPPSETKHVGGAGARLNLTTLALPQLQPQRELVAAALVTLAQDEEACAKVLKLSERQRSEVSHNRALLEAPTMPAIDRYTGVLFDALDASTLATPARRWLGAHVLVQSAPFGPVGALDLLPAYRLSAGISLPGLPPLRKLWAAAGTSALETLNPAFILDLRSEAYVALAPVPDSVSSAYVRVVMDVEGKARALNHFNKQAKGLLVRALAESRPRLRTLSALRVWAGANGFVLRDSESNGILELAVGS